MTRPRFWMVAGALALVLTLGLAGAYRATQQPMSDASSAGDAAGGGWSPEEAADAEAARAGDPADRPRTVITLRSVIRTGEVAVTSDDLDAARDGLDDLLARLDGVVDQERTEHDEDGRIERSTIVVRVPSARFEEAMAGVQALGTVQHADTSAEDVTTEVIDVAERVETLENSLDRLQAYQRDAQDVKDLVAFEQQITQRESELQSLRARAAYLADQTSRSTITVRLSLPEKYVAPPGALEEAGFLTGLSAGWGALVNSAVVALTVFGAALPFLVVLGLLGAPAALLARRGLRRRTPTPAPEP